MTLDRRATWPTVAVLTAVGLVLRLLAARGALWLDEAWSATFAQEAGTALGVIWNINHDNNHILNTLWLQLVGPHAPPLLQRALSVASGTATIPLAAAFAHRRGDAAAIIAALAFAISPILVTYGAEARGYAPMLAATLTALLLVDRWLEDARTPAIIGLALTALIGMLAQPLMLASLFALTGWAGIAIWRRDGFARAAIATARVMGPALLAAAAVISLMLLAADHAPHGFTIGSYVPFAAADWGRALAIALGWTLGFTDGNWPVVVLAAILAAGLLWRRRDDLRTPLYVLALLACPLAFAVLQIGNVGAARYYLLAAIALLLLLAELLGDARLRWPVFAVVTLFVVGSARIDARIITKLRADPGRAVAAMRARAPAGTTLMLPDPRINPVLTWAASDARYPLTVVGSTCRPAPFLMIDRDRNIAPPPLQHLCCGTYRLIAQDTARGLSGTDWWLYRRIG